MAIELLTVVFAPPVLLHDFPAAFRAAADTLSDSGADADAASGGPSGTAIAAALRAAAAQFDALKCDPAKVTPAVAREFVGLALVAQEHNHDLDVSDAVAIALLTASVAHLRNAATEASRWARIRNGTSSASTGAGAGAASGPPDLKAVIATIKTAAGLAEAALDHLPDADDDDDDSDGDGAGEDGDCRADLASLMVMLCVLGRSQLTVAHGLATKGVVVGGSALGRMLLGLAEYVDAPLADKVEALAGVSVGVTASTIASVGSVTHASRISAVDSFIDARDMRLGLIAGPVSTFARLSRKSRRALALALVGASTWNAAKEEDPHALATWRSQQAIAALGDAAKGIDDPPVAVPGHGGPHEAVSTMLAAIEAETRAVSDRIGKWMEEDAQGVRRGLTAAKSAAAVPMPPALWRDSFAEPTPVDDKECKALALAAIRRAAEIGAKGTGSGTAATDSKANDGGAGMAAEAHAAVALARAESTAAASASIDEPSVSDALEIPTAPEPLLVTASSVTIGWTYGGKEIVAEAAGAGASASGTAFDVQWRRAGSSVWNFCSAPVAETRMTKTLLSPHVEYRFRVCAVKGSVRSPYSEPSGAVMTHSAPPPPCAALRCERVARTRGTISWRVPRSNNGSPMTGYSVAIRDARVAQWRFVLPDGRPLLVAGAGVGTEDDPGTIAGHPRARVASATSPRALVSDAAATAYMPPKLVPPSTEPVSGKWSSSGGGTSSGSDTDRKSSEVKFEVHGLDMSAGYRVCVWMHNALGAGPPVYGALSKVVGGSANLRGGRGSRGDDADASGGKRGGDGGGGGGGGDDDDDDNGGLDGTATPGAYELHVDEVELDDIAWDSPRKLLGKGGFGSVYRSAVGGFRGETVAVKEMTALAAGTSADDPVDADQARALHVEVAILAGLRHPNLVQLLGACLHPPHYFFVMEYCAGGSLGDAMYKHKLARTWSVRFKVGLAMQIADAMNYLHSRPVPLVHRDLKPQNILMDEARTTCKVCDFGLARARSASVIMTRAAGTYEYLAPEAFRADEAITETVDVYAFAVVLNELLAGRPPWPGHNMYNLTLAVAVERKRPAVAPDVPQELSALVIEAWRHDAVSRPTFAEIKLRLARMQSALAPGPVRGGGAVAATGAGTGAGAGADGKRDHK